MIFFRFTAAAAVLSCATAAWSASDTLDNLVAGATLTEGVVTFDGFTYDDVGGSFGDYAVPADSIIVSTFASGDNVGLNFTFDPFIDLSAGDVYEIVGGFTATASGALITDVLLELLGAGASGTELFSFIEVGLTDASDDTALAVVDLQAAGGGTVSDGTSLGGVGSFAFGWDSQGEAEEIGGSASLVSFSVTLTLERETPPEVVPLPATLPLLLGGVGLIAVARRRRS